MGGENSEIKDDTTMVVFESANFNGTSIRQTALSLGMRTEASSKFEKSLDPMMTIPAVQRACELVEMLECGDVLDGTIDIINYIPEPNVKEQTLVRLLGADRLDNNDKPNPNGYFDYVQGYTVSNGRVFFPKAEPFGQYLKDYLVKAGVPADSSGIL